MASISRVISDCQGLYEWGKRDCLLTASAVIRAQGQRPPDYKSWHAMDESQAILLAIQQYDSMIKAHSEVFLNSGLKMTHSPKQPGDICLLEGVLKNNQLGIFMDVKAVTRLGFVTESYEVWTWFKPGLYPLHEYTLKGIARCQR